MDVMNMVLEASVAASKVNHFISFRKKGHVNLGSGPHLALKRHQANNHQEQAPQYCQWSTHPC